jgi:hypothetical protein
MGYRGRCPRHELKAPERVVLRRPQHGRCWGELDRIVEKVRHRLEQQIAIPQNGARRRNTHIDGNPFLFGRRLIKIGGLPYDVDQIDLAKPGPTLSVLALQLITSAARANTLRRSSRRT